MKFILALIFTITTLSAHIPAGYYDSASGVTGTDLQQALHDIIDNHSEQSYTSLWTHFQTTDVRPDSAGTVWDMYSDIPGSDPPYWLTYVVDQDNGTGGTVEGDKYNREHSWPSSWFGGKILPMYSDLFHLYPTDKLVNNRRGNYPFGEVTNPSWTSLNGSKLGNNTTPGYSGTVFEPIDEYKGDFARTYFYMSTRYYKEDSSWSTNDMVVGAQLKQWALEMMLEWHVTDQVSQKEIDRNNGIYAIQQNRNPYIDHPGFTNLIWGGAYPVAIHADPIEVPTDMNLLPAYPNPFNAGTIINYNLRQATHIKLDVFNLEGQLVSQLVDAEVSAGYHELSWSGLDQKGSDLASGVYLLRLSSPESQNIQRITILR